MIPRLLCEYPRPIYRDGAWVCQQCGFSSEAFSVIRISGDALIAAKKIIREETERKK